MKTYQSPLVNRQDILSALEGLHFTLYRIDRGNNPEYTAGFEDCLAAVARAFGLSEFDKQLVAEQRRLSEVTK